jgi:2-keto-4-pentenoate hydratase/2-oxohepta-3-ene-1,7-dioic acid hydratase in catechol pathway
MKIARFRVARRTAYGVVTGEELVEIRGSIYTRFRLTDIRYPLGDVKLLPPTDPANMWGPGLNFADHAQFAASVLGESNPSTPNHPEPWHKSRNALTGHQDPIIIPRDSNGDVHYEGEAVAVIGKNCRRVTPAQAPRMILGYTCGNDVSHREVQLAEMAMGVLLLGKGYDSFCPLGPVIATGLDPSNLMLETRLNGERRQQTSTSDLLFSVPHLIAFMTRFFTLLPGDVISTGTPSGVGNVAPGDSVEIEIEGIGVLRNHVVAEG